MTRQVFPAGSRVTGQTGTIPALHLIVRGRVRIERRHPEVRESLVLLECGPGDLVQGIGECDAAGLTTVTALEETETVELTDGDAVAAEWVDSHGGPHPAQSSR